MTTKLKNQGFTLVELLISIVIVGILSGVGIMGYRQHTKRAHEIEVKTQLSAASRKLIPSVSGFESVSDQSCLDRAGLNDSNNFSYSCKTRDDQSNIFDIHVKPLRDVGVGGLLSFGEGYDKICWDTCDATGIGAEAQLAKNHLDLNNGCIALTRKESQVDCNCTQNVKRECLYYPGGHKTKPRRPPLCGLWICKGWDKPRCRDVTTTTCDKCVEVDYVNEQGVSVEIN